SLMKTAVITGAGTGIGAATAALFSSRGYATVLIGRNKNNLESVAGKIKNSSVEICNLQDSNAVQALGRKLAQIPDLEVLINNAGIIERKAFEEVSEKSIRDQFETNLF